MSTHTTPTHTPGPWRAKHHGIGIIGLAIETKSGSPVGTARKAEDARLIAAAPEMLAALQAVWAGLECTGYPIGELGEKVRTAIAKAEGRA